MITISFQRYYILHLDKELRVDPIKLEDIQSPKSEMIDDTSKTTRSIYMSISS